MIVRFSPPISELSKLKRGIIIKHLDDSSKSSLGVKLLEGRVQEGRDAVDDAVVTSDVDGVGRSSAEVVDLADDGVVEESLAVLALVGDLLSVEGLDVSADGAGGVLADKDVVLEDVGEVGVGLWSGGAKRRRVRMEWT